MELPNENTTFNIIEELKDPVAWMEMARLLRRAGDVLEERVRAAANAQLTAWDKRERGEEVSDDEQQRLTSEAKNSDLFRVSQMLYQMSYENALKGILTIQGKDVPNQHDLTLLAERAGLQCEEFEMKHLWLLSRMNQLGRYRVGKHQVAVDREDGKVEKIKKDTHGAKWSHEDERRRQRIDERLADLWLMSGGPIEYSEISPT